MKNLKSELDLLRVDIPFLSKLIVEEQYKLQPEFNRYGGMGMLRSLEDASSNLNYLFSSVEVESKSLFEQYNIWVNQMFTNIKLPTKTMENFYLITCEVLGRKFLNKEISKEIHDELVEYIHYGMQALKSESIGNESYIRVDNPYSELLEKYHNVIFTGDKNALMEFMNEILNKGVSIRNIYKYIMQPFQQELGRLWHMNKISVAQEHYSTALSQFAMSLLYERIFTLEKNGKTFLGTCVQGELHEIGIRMVCDYMESSGWSTYYLGANMPEKAILGMIEAKKPDIIAISCTMTFHISQLSSLIRTIKDSGIKTPVIVGGYPFEFDQALCNKLGADGYSKDFEEAFWLSEKLYENNNEVAYEDARG